MSPPIQLSIPTTSLATSPGKPHTLYNINLRLPLRTLTVAKRYNDFLTLHSQLTSTVGSPPPLNPPPKSYFTRTISNPALTENRRVALEAYLNAILSSPDDRWRSSPPWRTFLTLPSNWSPGSSSTSLASPTAANHPITDPAHWLDIHREVKTLLHDARMFLAKRDQAISANDQYEASAGAKRCLVRSSTLIAALDAALRDGRMGSNKEGGSELLDGEIRRRRDLVAGARKERDGLESLANSMASKRATATATAADSDRGALFMGATGGRRPRVGGGRVLGAPLPETDKTRELDNSGLVLLNGQYMREQDNAVESLLGNVTRMKEIGMVIGEEIESQNRMLSNLDQDVDKVDKKMRIAKKRVNGIS
ncbi:Phox homologous domain-containing protein [Morchella snyderi]|nr:Phox homologous domain-containing protein [Morchella snyderi]